MVEFERKIEADHWFMERYVVRTLIFFQELDCLTEELKRSDFSKASNEAIAAKIKYIWEEQKRFIGGWYYSLQLDAFYGAKIEEELHNLFDDKEIITSLTINLTASTVHDTDLMKEKKDIIAIARLAKEHN